MNVSVMKVNVRKKAIRNLMTKIILTTVVILTGLVSLKDLVQVQNQMMTMM